MVVGVDATLMWMSLPVSLSVSLSVSLPVLMALDGIVDRWVLVWVGLDLDGVVVVDRF